MAVLAHLGHQETRAPPFLLRKALNGSNGLCVEEGVWGGAACQPVGTFVRVCAGSYICKVLVGCLATLMQLAAVCTLDNLSLCRPIPCNVRE